MTILPLAWHAVLHVALYIRACDRVEIEAGMARYDAADLASRVIAFSRFGGVAMTDDGTPAAVVSAAELYPGVYQVSMFATDDWPQVARGMTRWIRRTMIPAMLAAGGHRAECRSIAGHETAHRWLESLGFLREAVLPDCGRGRETFFQYAWRLSDRRHHVLFQRPRENPRSRRLHRREDHAQSLRAL
jgi:hypothetical protein